MMADTGVAESMEPSTIIEIGSVARQTLVASDCPANPPTRKIIGICAPRKACAATSTATLRRARLSSIMSEFLTSRQGVALPMRKSKPGPGFCASDPACARRQARR